MHTFHESNYTVITRATKKFKFVLPFSKFMKRPENKFHADAMSHSQVIRSKKSKFIIWVKFVVRPNLSCRTVVFSLHRYFIETTKRIDMLLQVYLQF